MTSDPPQSQSHKLELDGLASFYRKFIRNFGLITLAITDCFRKGEFQWSEQSEQSLVRVKSLLRKGPVMALPNFDFLFELEYGAYIVMVGAMMIQSGHPSAYFREKLIDGRRNWITYEQKLYVVVWSCQHREHYLIHWEFVIHTDHLALKQKKSTTNSNRIYARWLSFLKRFVFTVQHRAGTSNKVNHSASVIT